MRAIPSSWPTIAARVAVTFRRRLRSFDGEEPMSQSNNSMPARRVLTARRLVLLASTAGLGIAVLFSGPGHLPNVSAFGNAAVAQTMQKPAGFADVVEKVKPAVISVRVKLDQGPQTSSEIGRASCRERVFITV